MKKVPASVYLGAIFVYSCILIFTLDWGGSLGKNVGKVTSGRDAYVNSQVNKNIVVKLPGNSSGELIVTRTPSTTKITWSNHVHVVEYSSDKTSKPQRYVNLAPQTDGLSEAMMFMKDWLASSVPPLNNSRPICIKYEPSQTWNATVWRRSISNKRFLKMLDKSRREFYREALLAMHSNMKDNTGVTLIVRTGGGHDWDLWSAKCLPRAKKCPFIKSVVVAHWNNSNALRGSGYMKTVYGDAISSGMGYRLIQNCTTGICYYLDDDRCFQECRHVEDAITLVLAQPTRIVTIVARSWERNLESTASCRHFEYYSGGWTFGLPTNSILSAQWGLLYRNIWPQVLKEYSSKIVNCEDLWLTWLQVLMNDAPHNLAKGTSRLKNRLFPGLMEEFPEIAKKRNVKKKGRLSNQPGHHEKRSKCVNILFKMFEEIQLFPMQEL